MMCCSYVLSQSQAATAAAYSKNADKNRSICFQARLEMCTS